MASAVAEAAPALVAGDQRREAPPALREAVRSLDVACVEQLLGSLPAPLALRDRDEDGQTLLHHCCEVLGGDPVAGDRVLELLLLLPGDGRPSSRAGAGASAGGEDQEFVDARNALGESALTVAARSLAAAAQAGTEPATPPLADDDRLAAVKRLLVARAAVDAMDELGGETPLMEAAFGGDLPLCHLLVFARADTSLRNFSGDSARDFAAASATTCSSQLLKLLTTPPREPWPSSPTAVPAQPTAEAAAVPCARAEERDLGKIHADDLTDSCRGHAEVPTGSDGACQDASRSGGGSLLEAVRQPTPDVPTVRGLLKAAPSLEAALSERDAHGRTPLHLLAAAPPSARGVLATMALLLQRRAATDVHDVLGETPLLLATRGAIDAAADAVATAAAADSPATTSAAAAAAAAATTDRSFGLLRLLLERRADPNAADLVGETPLFEVACRRFHPCGSASPLAREKPCAIEEAVQAQRKILATVCKLLLLFRADPTRRSHAKRTALDVAESEGHLEVVELLWDAAGDGIEDTQSEPADHHEDEDSPAVDGASRRPLSGEGVAATAARAADGELAAKPVAPASESPRSSKTRRAAEPEAEVVSPPAPSPSPATPPAPPSTAPPAKSQASASGKGSRRAGGFSVALGQAEVLQRRIRQLQEECKQAGLAIEWCSNEVTLRALLQLAADSAQKPARDLRQSCKSFGVNVEGILEKGELIERLKKVSVWRRMPDPVLRAEIQALGLKLPTQSGSEAPQLVQMLVKHTYGDTIEQSTPLFTAHVGAQRFPFYRDSGTPAGAGASPVAAEASRLPSQAKRRAPPHSEGSGASACAGAPAGQANASAKSQASAASGATPAEADEFIFQNFGSEAPKLGPRVRHVLREFPSYSGELPPPKAEELWTETEIHSFIYSSGFIRPQKKCPSKAGQDGGSYNQMSPVLVEKHYRTLGLKVGTQATEVRKAYRRLALRHHPDKNHGRPGAAERFQEISEARNALSRHFREAAQ